MSTYQVIEYTEDYLSQWDEFVFKRSVNGTFLQTRNFLNYHPRGRFVDASLLIYDKNHLVAVVPACLVIEDGKKVFYSHKGSTYGGIVINRKYYYAEKTIRIIQTIDEYISDNFDKSVFKITADVYSNECSDLLQYALSYCGYSNYTELNTYINLCDIQDNVIASFDRNKMRNIRKCEEHGLYFRELVSDEEIGCFHNLLEINLSKYNLKPVHTVDDMISFKHDRIPNNVKFYGVFNPNGVIMAGGMIFVFEQANVIHAQNLSADYNFKEYSPITYMYYKVIENAKYEGYKALSWGISTEANGKVLNLGLIRNKEAYGSKYQLNRTFFKG